MKRILQNHQVRIFDIFWYTHVPTYVRTDACMHCIFAFILKYALFQEYEETCLFIIARFSASESLRVCINILKIPPPFASRTDIPLVGFAMRAWARESATHCLILILLAQREDVFISAHVFLYLFSPLFLYLVILFFNYYFYSDIITLWLSCAYFTAVFGGCWRINTLLWISAA